jgi:hypothetical protein
MVKVPVMGAISPCTGLEITTTACPLQSMIHFEALRASPQEELSSVHGPTLKTLDAVQ